MKSQRAHLSVDKSWFSQLFISICWFLSLARRSFQTCWGRRILFTDTNPQAPQAPNPVWKASWRKWHWRYGMKIKKELLRQRGEKRVPLTMRTACISAGRWERKCGRFKEMKVHRDGAWNRRLWALGALRSEPEKGVGVVVLLVKLYISDFFWTRGKYLCFLKKFFFPVN